MASDTFLPVCPSCGPLTPDRRFGAPSDTPEDSTPDPEPQESP